MAKEIILCQQPQNQRRRIMATKQISIFANEQELKDFQFIKERLERNSDSDTVRAMISMCKKILEKNVATATIIPTSNTL